MFKHIIIIIALLAVPVFGQIECDINNDGINGFSIADFIWLSNVLSSSPDSYYICDVNCDPDEDGNPLAVSDIMILINYLVDPGPPGFAPNFPRHPELDTLIIESAITSPGDNIILPMYLKTVDTLTAYQFYIVADTNCITLDSIILNPDVNLRYANCPRSIHGFAFDADLPSDSVILLPGIYHLGDLSARVNSNIDEPVTTYITFSGCPEENFYTGLANLTFFQPILVDAEITITPTGVNRDVDGILPVKVSIEAHPNPFNSSVSITVTSPIKSQFVIYDLLGRAVRTLPVGSGTTRFNWNATDDGGKSVGTGIYFAKIAGSEQLTIKKLLYLK